MSRILIYIILLLSTPIITAQDIPTLKIKQNNSLTGAYLKSSVGYSHGIKSVNSGINEIKTESQTVYIRPGSGLNVTGSIGIFIYYNICLEIGAGYIANYKYFTNGNIAYEKFPIYSNIVFYSNISEQKYIYIGFGAGQYLSTKFNTEVERHLRVITYSPTQFAKGIIGLRKKSLKSRSFWFGELTYTSCKKPTLTTETFNLLTNQAEENFLFPSLNGFTFNVGFGFGI